MQGENKVRVNTFSMFDVGIRELWESVVGITFVP